jgi:hypothetical protein
MEMLNSDCNVESLDDSLVIPKSKETTMTGKCLRLYNEKTGIVL